MSSELSVPGSLLTRVRTGVTSRRGPTILVIGTVMLGLLLVACLGAPLFTDQSPTALHPSDALLPPGGEHLFGTNQYGQDIFARTLYGGRVNMLIGVVLVGTAMLIGTTVGLIAAWRGGWVDAVIGRIVDVGFAFPFLVLVIAIVGLRGPGLVSLFIAVGVVSWIFYVRLVRSDVLVIKEQNYIIAAQMSGFSAPRVVVRHVLPNAAAQLLVFATSDFVYAVLLGASVSYLGLGVQPPTPEWGAMVQAGQNFVSSAWWISFFPGLAIVYTGITFAALGDGLAEVLRVGDSR